jgi:microcystin-dependent protein
MAELNNSGTGQWSETDANNTSPPPDGAPVGTFPNQAEGIWRAIMGALKRFWDRSNATVTTTGSAGAYVYTPSNTSFPTAYAQGETYVWRANFTSVGGDTLNVNALGARALYKPTAAGLTAVGAGDIQSGQIVHSVYDGNLAGGAGGFQIAGGVAAPSLPSEGIAPQTGGNFTIGTASPNTLFVVSGTAAVATLPSAGAGGVGVGYRVGVKNQSDGLAVTFAPQSGDTIDGQTSFRVPGRGTAWLIKDSTGSWTVEARPAYYVGDVKEWAVNTLPEGGWAWLNAQTLSRTTYGGLFAVWGTTYGAGDGSTTFGVRDDRGRVKAGNDAMGGASAANRLTSGGSGIAGTTTGAGGGTETVTLSTAQLPPHNHGVSDPGHGHGVSDPGHGHGVSDPGHSHTFTTNNESSACGPNNPSAAQGFGTNAASSEGTSGSGTGISIAGAGTGISIVGATCGITTANAGSGNAHQNTQPTIITNFIVKT